jgi:hypothetical protein
MRTMGRRSGSCVPKPAELLGTTRRPAVSLSQALRLRCSADKLSDPAELFNLALISRGGAEGNRTPDLLNAIQALSQLSYGPADGRRSYNR